MKDEHPLWGMYFWKLSVLDAISIVMFPPAKHVNYVLVREGRNHIVQATDTESYHILDNKLPQRTKRENRGE